MRNVNFLIKPASSLCNLRCRYCFYEDEAENRSMPSMGIMSQETAQLLIQRAYEDTLPGDVVSFAFQGGEPTLAGLDFFREFVRKAKEQKPERVRLLFSIQTNGFLIDEEWARFFRQEDFLVGISVDGYKDLHNAHRVDASGKNTWNRIVRSVEIMKKEQVKYNALCVVTAQCARSAKKSYESLKKLGFQYIQYIACLDPIDLPRGQMPWSLKPEAYGKFLCELFDLWYQDWERDDYHSIRLFDDYVHLLMGVGGSTCATCGQCGAYYVAEADGSLYPCDFYALDEWRMGSLADGTLEEIRKSEAWVRFAREGQQKPAECAACPFRILCNGGCRNDWVHTEDGPHNYFCSSFRMLFSYAGRRMQQIAKAQLSM